jgi:hypothetical protein
MKLSRKTKIRIRRTVAFVRTLCAFLCIICLLLTAISADASNSIWPFAFIGLCVLFFVVAALLDELLWQTAWSGDKPAPWQM